MDADRTDKFILLLKKKRWFTAEKVEQNGRRQFLEAQ